MTEEEKIFAGTMFNPSKPELRALKRVSHELSAAYSRSTEDETELRQMLLRRILGGMGEHVFMQGPIFFHYGSHTTIGDYFFANYNFTVQDDGPVTIGDHVDIGPNVTIVTPIHPMVAEERVSLIDEEGNPARLCYVRPVHIGSRVWLGANVVVCGGANIGDGCVIGAGSVVTGDIPPNSFAAGVPCRVIRPITEKDSMRNQPDRLGGCRVPE